MIDADARGARCSPTSTPARLAAAPARLVLAQGEAIRAPRRRGACSPGSPRSRPRWAAAAARAGARPPAPARRRAARRPAPQVTLERLCALISARRRRARARERSAELRGLLAEIAREHGINRALMRQELAFLYHLVRLVGDEPEAGYQPGGAAAPRRRRRGPPLHHVARPAGLSACRSPPSSASRPSLRGLLAQQRALDVTGHNIANASTRGLLAPGGRAWPPRRRCVIPAGARPGRRRRAPRHGRRRPGLPPHPRHVPRPPVPRAGHAPRRRGRPRRRALDHAELALAEPGDDGIDAQLSSSGTPGPTSPTPPSDPARPPGAARAGGLARRRVRDRRRPARRSSASRPRDEYAALTGAGGEVDADRRASSPRSTTRSSAFVDRGRQPNDLLDQPRPAARPALRARHRCRSTDNGDGSVDVDFGDAGAPSSTATGCPLAAGARHEPRRPARRAAGALDGPAARSTPTAPSSTRSPQTLADAVNALHDRRRRHASSPRAAGSYGAATLAVAVDHRDACATGTTRAPGANDIALAIAALRGGAPDSAYQRVRRPGRHRRRARPRATRPTPRRSPTRSRTAARASPASRSTRR